MSFFDEIARLTNEDRTENGDVSYLSTLNPHLDLFAKMGSMRGQDITELFKKSFAADEATAIALAFHLRDIRGGIGERDLFRSILLTISEHSGQAQKMIRILPFIAEYGRWDDVVWLMTETKNQTVSDACADLLRRQLTLDMKADRPSLMAKWLPSINASSSKTRERARAVAREFGVDHATYRKLLSKLRQSLSLVENHLREGDYAGIEYSHVPGRAMRKYNRAFERNDEAGYRAYLDALESGRVEAKAGTLYPHEILSPVICRWGYMADVEPSNAQRTLIQAQWDAIDRGQLADKRTICVLDGSASMYGGDPQPIDVAVSLALLMSEQLPGDFKNKFITFSYVPRLVDVSHLDSVVDRARYMIRYDDVAYNTDIMKVYKLIFEAQKNLPVEEQIERIVIASDMQFDDSFDHDRSRSTYDTAKSMFEDAGMKLPEIVYWDVSARSLSHPSIDLENVKLVSGYSANTMKNVMADESLSATDFMLETLAPYAHVARAFTGEL